MQQGRTPFVELGSTRDDESECSKSIFESGEEE